MVKIGLRLHFLKTTFHPLFATQHPLPPALASSVSSGQPSLVFDHNFFLNLKLYFFYHICAQEMRKYGKVVKKKKFYRTFKTLENIFFFEKYFRVRKYFLPNQHSGVLR